MLLINKFWRAAAVAAVSLSVGAGAHAQTPADDINLVIDASTGGAVLQNVGAAPLDLLGVSIFSENGLLNPGGLTILSGFEAATTNDANGVAQFPSFANIGTPFSLPVGDTPIGSPVAENFSAQLEAVQTSVGFGNATDDLLFEFGATDENFDPIIGDVIIENEQSNNFILEITPSSGLVRLINDSSLDVQIAAIQINSPAEALAQANYTGFSGASRAVAGWGFNAAQNSTGGIAETLSPIDSPFDTIAAGEAIPLGNAYTQGAEEDGDLSFTVNLVGGEGVLAEDIGQFSGQVVFVPGGGGDANGDGLVNVLDYVIIRDTSADVVTDHAAFVAGFDAGGGGQAIAFSAPLPEPGSVLLLIPFAAAGIARRVRDR